MSSDLKALFRTAHLELKPRTPVPEIFVEFFPFAGLNHTARLRDERLYIRVSDVFADAPTSILQTLALILLAKLYRKQVHPTYHQAYRVFILQPDIQDRARQARVERGRRLRTVAPPGRHHDLRLIFDRLNTEYFGGELERPRLSWSVKRSRRILGRYDATHHIIFISRIFDSAAIPAYVLDYVVFHEMLHIKHQSRSEGCRLRVHTGEFRAEERAFRHYPAARDWLANW